VALARHLTARGLLQTHRPIEPSDQADQADRADRADQADRALYETIHDHDVSSHDGPPHATRPDDHILRNHIILL
jgi:hypothetical protein